MYNCKTNDNLQGALINDNPFSPAMLGENEMNRNVTSVELKNHDTMIMVSQAKS